MGLQFCGRSRWEEGLSPLSPSQECLLIRRQETKKTKNVSHNQQSSSWPRAFTHSSASRQPGEPGPARARGRTARGSRFPGGFASRTSATETRKQTNGGKRKNHKKKKKRNKKTHTKKPNTPTNRHQTPEENGFTRTRVRSRKLSVKWRKKKKKTNPKQTNKQTIEIISGKIGV